MYMYIYTTTCSSDLIECHLQIVVDIFVPHVVHDIAGDTSPRKHIHLHMRGRGGRRRGKRRGRRRVCWFSYIANVYCAELLFFCSPRELLIQRF